MQKIISFIENITKRRYYDFYVFWLFIFVLIFDYHFYEVNWKYAIGITIAEQVMYMSVFYFNYSYAAPKLLDKKKYGQYYFVMALLLSVYLVIYNITGLDSKLYFGSELRSVITIIINYTLFWLISNLYFYYRKHLFNKSQKLKLEAEKLKTEMKFLKSQISPHFIFNTLNNIYSLIQTGHPNAAPLLGKLSSILRYAIYETAKDDVLLSKEIDLLREYVSLHTLRKPLSENIDFYTEGNFSQKKIPPLILLTFVENAFKHGNIDQCKDGWVKISATIDKDHIFNFSVENSVGLVPINNPDSSGLGNANLQKQLEYYYPKKHTLISNFKESTYSTFLSINMS